MIIFNNAVSWMWMISCVLCCVLFYSHCLQIHLPVMIAGPAPMCCTWAPMCCTWASLPLPGYLTCLCPASCAGSFVTLVCGFRPVPVWLISCRPTRLETLFKKCRCCEFSCRSSLQPCFDLMKHVPRPQQPQTLLTCPAELSAGTSLTVEVLASTQTSSWRGLMISTRHTRFGLTYLHTPSLDCWPNPDPNY